MLSLVAPNMYNPHMAGVIYMYTYGTWCTQTLDMRDYETGKFLTLSNKISEVRKKLASPGQPVLPPFCLEGSLQTVVWFAPHESVMI